MAKTRRFFDPTFKRQEKRKAYLLACVLFWSVLSYLAISRAVLSGAEVVGSSMVPTLSNGDHVLLNRLSYHLGKPTRGDVVALNLPEFPDMSVKRVIALPNEVVQIRDGRVFIEGEPLVEPYLPRNVRTGPGSLGTNAYEIAADCYFVLGDNRGDSFDSRRFGAVPREWIEGRIEGNRYGEFKF